MERLTKLQIIEETVKFYSEDTTRRALVEGSNFNCMYNTKDGRHCAVGRCLLPELQTQGTELVGNGASVSHFLKKNNYDSLDEALQEQYRGHDIIFWSYLQQLHDGKPYWNDKGLTECGKNNVESIKKEFCKSE